MSFYARPSTQECSATDYFLEAKPAVDRVFDTRKRKLCSNWFRNYLYLIDKKVKGVGKESFVRRVVSLVPTGLMGKRFGSCTSLLGNLPGGLGRGAAGWSVC